MEIIPILIIVLGVVSSIISGKKNKEKEGDRNIDPSKLDRRQSTAPRNRQPETTEEQKGFFQTLQEAFDEEFNKPDPQTTQTQQTAQKTRQTTQTSTSRNTNTNTDNRSTRTVSERPVRETIQKVSERKNSSQNISDIEKRISARAAHANRASESIGKDIIKDEHKSYDDETKMHQSGQKKSSRSAITKDDLTFDSKAVVNGFIFSEILGKPKSKR